MFTLNKTHRGRKERYSGRLEEHVLQLRGTHKDAACERDAVADENRKLKELLRAQGIAYPGKEQSSSDFAGNSSQTGAGLTSPTPNLSQGSATGPLEAANTTSQDNDHDSMHGASEAELDQRGIDFVLRSVPQWPCWPEAIIFSSRLNRNAFALLW